MHSLLEWFQKHSESIAIIVGGIFVAISAAASVLAQVKQISEITSELFQRWIGPSSPEEQRILDNIPHRPPIATPSQIAKERAAARIEEARDALRQQLSAAKWSRVSSNSLTVSQYIIGGLLASSFVQESLSPKLVGSLGLLVLLASLIKQHFHPDVSAETAIKKAAQLRALIRTSEDQLAILDAKIASGQDHTDEMISLLMKITEQLTGIEMPEVTEQRPTPSQRSA